MARRLSRRSFTGAALSLPLALAPGATLQAARELVVGYLYVGHRHDFGYNQSHALAADRVARLSGVRVVEQENVSESEEAASAMEAMIVQEGARLLFPTSYGYFDPYILRLAQKYPDVYFQHAGSLWRKGRHPGNVGSYLCHMHEGQYLAGVVAGGVTNSGKLGFVAAKRYPGVMRNINAFALGVRSVRPEARISVVFTGSWSDPVREAETVNALADQGSDVFGCSVDSAATVVATALRRRLHACGYNASLSDLGNEAYLTASIALWEKINIAAVEKVRQGGRPANFVSGGLAEGLVTIDELGPAVLGWVRDRVAAVKSSLVSGEKAIWTGPMFDNTGRKVIGEGLQLARTDLILKQMDWFVEGVQA